MYTCESLYILTNNIVYFKYKYIDNKNMFRILISVQENCLNILIYIIRHI